MDPFKIELSEDVMTCPECQTEVAQNANYCSACGLELRSERNDLTQPDKSTLSKSRAHSDTGVFRKISGLRRTLSTEMIAREDELNTLAKLNALVEGRIHREGDVIIQKGEKNRDLFFLTEGLVEISTKEKDGNVILNEFSAPNVLGDIGFLFGFPRTATARAKTKVKVYVLKYEKMMQEIGGSELTGPILLGLGKPIHILQMESEVREIVDMAAFASVDAQFRG